MLLLFGYLVLNVLISGLLDKDNDKYKVAKVLHAVVFFAVLCVIVISQSGIMADMFANTMGKEYYDLVYELFTRSNTAFLSPIMMLEAIIPFIAVLVTSIYAYKVVKYIRSKRAPYVKRASNYKPFFRSCGKYIGFADRIYIRNCVFRC